MLFSYSGIQLHSSLATRHALLPDDADDAPDGKDEHFVCNDDMYDEQ